MDPEVIKILEETKAEILHHKKAQHIEFRMLETVNNCLKNNDSYWKDKYCAENIVSNQTLAENYLRVMEATHNSNHQSGGYGIGQTDRTLKGRYEWIKAIIESKFL